MFTTSLGLEPGSNVLTLVVPRSRGEPKLPDLAELLGNAIGAPLEDIGELRFAAGRASRWWLCGDARPLTTQVMPTTAKRTAWYAELGSPVGADPYFVTVNIEWRGEPTRIEWRSDTWVAPKGSRAVRGAASWPDYSTADEYRRWAIDAQIAEVVAPVATSVENVGKAVGSSLDALRWPLIGVGVVVAAILWFRSQD